MKYAIVLSAMLLASFNLFAAENLDKYVGKYVDEETRETYTFVKKDVRAFVQHLCAWEEVDTEYHFDYYALKNAKGESEFGLYVNKEEGWVYIMGEDRGVQKLGKKNCYDKPELAGKNYIVQGSLSFEQNTDFVTFKNLHRSAYGMQEGYALRLEWNGDLTLVNYDVGTLMLSAYQKTASKKLKRL